MGAKDDIYASVDVDLARWASDQMQLLNLTQAQLARRLRYSDGQELNRARVTELLTGKLNTRRFLKVVAESFEMGHYRKLLPYATSPEGEQVVKDMDFEHRLRDGKHKEVWFKELEKCRIAFLKRHKL